MAVTLRKDAAFLNTELIEIEFTMKFKRFMESNLLHVSLYLF